MKKHLCIAAGISLCICVIIIHYFMLSKTNHIKKELAYYKDIVEHAQMHKDSIEYIISYKDSTIINIKKETKYEIELIETFPDNESVALFNELVWQ